MSPPGLASPVAETVPRRRLLPHDLAEKARQVRVETLRMTYAAGSGHPGGSFSMAEAVAVLYHNVLDVSPLRLDDPDRDVFILSKGHCAPGLYAVLGDLGFFPKTEFPRLRRLGGLLQGHADRKVPGIEMSTGSLGMGLGYGNGVALAKRMDGRRGHVWVLLGDGELQEGNIWESALSSAHRRLDNLTVLVDHNRIQIDGFVKEVKGVEPVADKFRAFGFEVLEADGHDVVALERAFEAAQRVQGKPTCIVLATVKGKGVSFMEDNAEFHGRALKADEMRKAMQELGEAWNP